MPRSFFIGVDQGVTTALQWHESTDAWATRVDRVAPPAAVGSTAPVISIFSSSLEQRGCTSADGTKFFYPAAYTVGNSQPIRMWDNDTLTDSLLTSIPINSHAFSDVGAGNYAVRGGCGIRQMLHDGVNNRLYIVTIDLRWLGVVGTYSRVMVYDFNTATLSQVGNFADGWGAPNPVSVGSTSSGGSTGGSSGAFWCCALFGSDLYVGYGADGSASNSIEHGIYRISAPGVGGTFTYDWDNSANAFERPTCMVEYDGDLYVGFNDANTALSHIRKRNGGSYTSVRTVGSGVDSGWSDMIVFDGNLYACAFDNNAGSSITTVHKFDGTTWSVVKTLHGPIANPRIGVAMLVADDTLFVFALNASQSVFLVTKTLDGTTWTDFTFNTGAPQNATSVFGGAGASPPPDVDAGPDQEVFLPGAPVQFAAQIIDEDNFPVPATFLWTFVSGPVTIDPATAFDDDTSLTPVWTPTVAGVYVFRITADDTEATDFDDVQITVTQLPEPEFSIGDGRVSHPLTWLEMTDRESNKKVFSEVDLNDPEWYFGGYKYPWVLEFRTISRGLSDRNGQPEHMSFGASISDTERYFREALAHPINRYLTNRPLTVRMIDDEDRRQQLNPMIAAIGYVSDYSPKQDMRFDLIGTDWIKRKFSRKAKAALAWQPQITVEDFPAAGVGLENSVLGNSVPIIYGSLSDKNESTIIVPGDPGTPTTTGLKKPTGLTANVVGGAGSATYTYGVTALDNRKRTEPTRRDHSGETDAAYVTVNNAPELDEMSPSRYVELDWDTVAKAGSYRIYGRKKNGGVNLNLLDSARGPEHPSGGSEERYNDGERNGHVEVDREKTDSHPPAQNNTVVTGDPGTPDSTIVVDTGKGLVPVIYVGPRTLGDGLPWHEFLVCKGACKSIHSWYVDGVRVADSTADVGGNYLIPGWPGWNAIIGTDPYVEYNGNRYTSVFLRTGFGEQIAQGEEVLTLNLEGVESVGDGSGELLRTPASQCLHFLNNYLAPETPYASGNYLTASDSVFEHETLVPLVDEDSFAQVEADALERITDGYETAGIIGSGNEKVSAMDVLAKFNVSGDFDSTFTRKGQYSISMEPLSQEAGLSTLDDVISIVDRSFEMTDLVNTEFFNILPYTASKDYVGRTQEGWGVVTDKRSDISIELYEQERESSRYELAFGRTETTRMANTVADGMNRKLNRYRNPRRRATLTVPFSGIPYQPGSIATITHVEGVGASGWINHDVRIVRQEIDATRGQVKLDVYDLEQLFETMGLWAPEDTPDRDASTDAQKSRYMYWADEVDLFYSDGAPVKTWT